MRLESAEHHRADPHRAQSRIRVQAASAPNRGDRTVRFPVVMAGSRVSLCSLGSTYSTALFAVNAGEISLRLQAECGKTTCRSTHECYGRLVSSQEAA